jgi:ATP-binding cassette ChvD family protein
MQNAYENQQRVIADKERTITRFMAKASKTKMAQSMQKQLDKLERIEIADMDTATMRIRFPDAPRAGEVVAQVEHLTKRYGNLKVLENVDFHLERGERVAFVGQNGQGKTTLAKILIGQEPATSGKAVLGHNVSIGYYAQNQAETLDPKLTLLQTMENNSPEEMRTKLRSILGAFLFSGEDVDKKVSALSGGERARLALACMLLRPFNLLLLDEPTNHLDAESVQWLEQHLAQYPGAVLAVTHDRYFLDNVAQWIAEVDRGRLYPYEGNYSTYLEKKAERLQIQGRKDAKLAKRLKDELEWVRSNAKGRQAKSKARLARYEEMAAEADRTRKLDFEEIAIPPGPRLGSQVIEVRNLRKGFGDRVLIDNLSFTLPRNGIVGVIGPNGVGKTTLFKTIVGLEAPDAGEVKIGETVKISYVDQARAGLDPNKTLWEVVSDGLDYMKVGQVEIPSRAYVSQFGFKGPDQQKPAGVLSGGERNRLNLALTLKQGGNLLLLDEPSNDLDVETLGSLENALLDFPGCAVVISHDRWFLDRVATHILAYEGDEDDPAKWYWFEGNFDAYEKNKIERLGEEATRPHRVTYRKLTRD